MLRCFSNTQSVDGKYSLFNTDNLKQPIQMRLSQKQKTFSEFFFHFWNLVQILNILEKRWPIIAHVFPILQTPKKVVRSTSKKSRFRGSFEKQHSKRAQTLLKFKRQHLYHIYWSICKQLTYKKVSVSDMQNLKTVL